MIVEHIGRPAMYEQLAEEAAELSFAALKMARILRKENPTPKTEQEMAASLVEEASDLKLCLDDLGILPDKDIIKIKAARFKQRWKAAQDQ